MKKRRGGYWSEIPDIVRFLGLSKYARLVYWEIHAYAQGGRRPCTASGETIAKQVGISTGSVSNAKKELSSPFALLGGKPLIRVKDLESSHGMGRPRDEISLEDIWKENAAFAETNRNAQHPDGVTPLLHGVKKLISPHERKKDMEKKNNDMHPSRLTGRGETSCIPDKEELEKLGYDEDEAEILAMFNRVMTPHGYRPVDLHTGAVCSALRGNGHGEVLDLETLQSIMDDAHRSGPPPKGEGTFVRMAHNYGL